jgi:hypothetical protein
VLAMGDIAQSSTEAGTLATEIMIRRERESKALAIRDFAQRRSEVGELATGFRCEASTSRARMRYE